MMTRLEQETYEVHMHSMPRIAEALERIAKALERMVVVDADAVNMKQAYNNFLSGLKSGEASDESREIKNGNNVSQARTD